MTDNNKEDIQRVVVFSRLAETAHEVRQQLEAGRLDELEDEMDHAENLERVYGRFPKLKTRG